MKTLIILIWIFVSQICNGQSLILSGDDDHGIMYNFVLETYLKEKLSTHVDNSILIEYNYFTTRDLPSKIGEVKINQVEVTKKLFKDKKHITILRMVPLRFIDGKFAIIIIEYDAHYDRKKNNINLINTENGKRFEFVHDCIKNELISTF